MWVHQNCYSWRIMCDLTQRQTLSGKVCKDDVKAGIFFLLSLTLSRTVGEYLISQLPTISTMVLQMYKLHTRETDLQMFPFFFTFFNQTSYLFSLLPLSCWSSTGWTLNNLIRSDHRAVKNNLLKMGQLIFPIAVTKQLSFTVMALVTPCANGGSCAEKWVKPSRV